MEQLQPELTAVRGEKGLVRPESDVAPGVEIELVQSFGKRRDRCVERGGGEIARAAHDILEIEFRRRGRRRRLSRRRRGES